MAALPSGRAPKDVPLIIRRLCWLSYALDQPILERSVRPFDPGLSRWRVRAHDLDPELVQRATIQRHAWHGCVVAFA